MRQIKSLGFTGTREGMQLAQFGAIRNLILGWDVLQFNHGDCMGADGEAHYLIREALPRCNIIIHPPIDPAHRAWCEGDIELVPQPYLKRDYRIVNDSDVMIATPKGMKEEGRGSGTWATIRCAKKRMRELYIVYPDGSIEVHNGQ